MKIRVGVDPILGMEDSYLLPSVLIQYLQVIGLNTLNKIHYFRAGDDGSAVWLSARDLGLSGYLARTWESYINNLNSAGVKLNLDSDQIIWGGNPSTGIVTAKSAYCRILQDKLIFPQDWWYKSLWKWSVPLKFKCLMWLALQNKLKTWENLTKRGWSGPSICALCHNDAESSQHLFVNCSFTQKIWDFVSVRLKFSYHWDVGGFSLRLLNWYRKSKQFFTIAIFISWAIWYTRNCAIFQDFYLMLLSAA